MTILSEIPAQLLRARARAVLIPALIGAASIAAGCGSGGSSTITVGNENKADNALVSAGRPTSTTATTPTSGPLATEPVVTPPTGAAPRALPLCCATVTTLNEVRAHLLRSPARAALQETDRSDD